MLCTTPSHYVLSIRVRIGSTTSLRAIIFAGVSRRMQPIFSRPPSSRHTSLTNWPSLLQDDPYHCPAATPRAPASGQQQLVSAAPHRPTQIGSLRHDRRPPPPSCSAGDPAGVQQRPPPPTARRRPARARHSLLCRRPTERVGADRRWAVLWTATAGRAAMGALTPGVARVGRLVTWSRQLGRQPAGHTVTGHRAKG